MEESVDQVIQFRAILPLLSDEQGECPVCHTPCYPAYDEQIGGVCWAGRPGRTKPVPAIGITADGGSLDSILD